MLNRPWIDPRDVDWTDALSPVRNPGWARNNNPYVYNALNDPFMQAIRNAKGIQPRIYTGPDPQNNLIPAGQTQDYEVPIEPNFWLWALSVSGGAELDFLFNVTDIVTGSQLFSTPASAATMSTQTSGRGPLYYLETPHLYAPPSYPVIRVINTADADQRIRVNLFGIVEYDV